MTTLSLAWRIRPGRKNVSRFGGFQTERRYLDFVIGERSLFDMLNAADQDLIGVLGWNGKETDLLTVEQLLLRRAAPFPDGRQMIFVCGECGDIGCGAIRADVCTEGDQIVWKNFGFENNYDEDMSDFETYQSIGPFSFPQKEYTGVIETYLSSGNV